MGEGVAALYIYDCRTAKLSDYVYILKEYAEYRDAGLLGTMRPTVGPSINGEYYEILNAEVIIPSKDRYYFVENGYCCRSIL